MSITFSLSFLKLNLLTITLIYTLFVTFQEYLNSYHSTWIPYKKKF